MHKQNFGTEMDFKVATVLVQTHTLAISVNWDLNSILSLYWKSAENMFNMQIIICTLFEACLYLYIYFRNVYSPCLSACLRNKTHFPTLPMDVWYLVGTVLTKEINSWKKIPPFNPLKVWFIYSNFEGNSFDPRWGTKK